MVTALQHEVLPPTLHAAEPSPHVDWSGGAVRLLTGPVPWPADRDRPRRAGISAFGMSGTNAHLILQQPPAPVSPAPAVPAPAGPVLGAGQRVWVVSGRSGKALAAQAARLGDWLQARPGLDLAGVGWALASGRSVFEHRAVITGPGRAELLAGLGAVAAGEPAANVVTGVVPGAGPGRTVFVFPGQGSGWAGMGKELAQSSPVFAARLGECGQALAPFVDWSLGEVIAQAPGAPGLEAAAVGQPVLWAVMVALAAVWEAAGITPDAVIGHSQGEIAAATVAGILSLDDAARLVTARGAALSALGDAGAMLSVVMPEGQARDLISGWNGRLAVAAVNSPAAVVISGDPAALAGLETALARARVLRWPVPASDYIAHSAAVQDLEEPLTRGLQDLNPQPGRVPLYSTVTGDLIDGEDMDAAYWYANLRNTVQFATAIKALASSGHRRYLEISPHPVLATAITDTLPASASPGGPVLVTGTLDRDHGGPDRFLTALARAHTSGATITWTTITDPAPPAPLPTYAFQHTRYWTTPTPAPAPDVPSAPGTGAGTRPAGTSDPATWRYRITWTATPGLTPTSVPGRLAAGTWLIVAPAGGHPLTAQVAAALAARGAEVTVTAVSAGQDRAGLARALSAAAATAAATGGADARPGTVTVADGVNGIGAHADGGNGHGTGNGTPAAGNGNGTAAANGNGTAAAARNGNGTAAGDGNGTPDVGNGTAAAAGNANGAEAGPGPLAGVVSLLALAEDPLPTDPVVPAGLDGTLTVIQGLGDAGISAPLWIVTSQAVAVGPEPEPLRPVQAQAWGLGRVAALEYPDRWGGLIDLPAHPDAQALGRFAAVLASPGGEDAVAIRPAGTFVRRLAQAPLPEAAPLRGAMARPWAPRGTTLVTGGTGAIGLRVARWAADRGAPRLLLASRSGPAAPGVAAHVARLAAVGTGTTVTACDIADRDQTAALLAGVPSQVPLANVIHTAGVLDDGLIDHLDTGRLATTLAAKAAGAAHLHDLTTGHDLDTFVLFSSAAAVFGNAGQGNYAAANAYLDALAETRAAQGSAALSVAWGQWGGDGLAQSSEAIQQRLRRNGMPPMDPEAAVQALAQAIDEGETTVAIMDIDWAQLAATPDATTVPLLRDLPEATPPASAPASNGDVGPGHASLTRQLALLPPADQLQTLLNLVRAEATSVLGQAADDTIEPDRAFSELGFDSLTTLELRQRLSAAAGLPLPATLLFDYPAPLALAEYLSDQLTADQAGYQPVLADLDRLRTVLSPIARNGSRERAEIAARLEAMLREFRAPADEDGPDRALAAATDDEMFDLIDVELESSEFDEP
jgi:acyl transferase domain-containing protein/acyl carrier protein